MKSIGRFLESYGSSGLEYDQEESAVGNATVSVAQFRREVRHFEFVTNLAINLKKPSELRNTFRWYANFAYDGFTKAHAAFAGTHAKKGEKNAPRHAALEGGIEGGRWQAHLQELAWCLRAPQPNLTDKGPLQFGTAPPVDGLCVKVGDTASAHASMQYHMMVEHLEELPEAALMEGARVYLTRIFMERLGNLKVVFEFEEDIPRLYIDCLDDLLLSFIGCSPMICKADAYPRSAESAVNSLRQPKSMRCIVPTQSVRRLAASDDLIRRTPPNGMPPETSSVKRNVMSNRY